MKKETYTPSFFEDLGEVYGQYASDQVTNDPYGTLGPRGTGDPGMHQENLYDEVDKWNPDEATGNIATDDDPYTEGGLEIVGEDTLALNLESEIDAAEAWLRANDPTHPRYGQ